MWNLFRRGNIESQTMESQDKDLLLEPRNEGVRYITIQPRAGSIITDSDDESTPRLPATPSPFSNSLLYRENSPPEYLRELVTDGGGIEKLVDECPGEVIAFLKKHAVHKLGTFTEIDSKVLKAFNGDSMITRGCQKLKDEDWQANWSTILDKRAKNNGKLSVGWEEHVTLGAYAVNIRDVATRDNGALLQLLLQKYSSGAATKRIWEYPAVRAVINYHWQHWAQRFLRIIFVLYLCWILSFLLYLVVYIQPNGDEINGGIPSLLKGPCARILSIASFSSMCPFALFEYLTIVALGRRWLLPGNLLDVGAILLQIFLFTCQMCLIWLTEPFFGVLLAIQCVFLCVKLQNYGRLMGIGASILEIFWAILYDVRYLLGYIIFTGICFSLSFGAIYKNDPDFHSKSLSGKNFKGTMNSFISTFEIIFGNFQNEFIFDSNAGWAKMLFFLPFQMLLTITALNLLIAVMTEAYSKFAADQRIQYNRGRAQLIDELDVLRVPDYFAKELQPYIHFLVIERRPKIRSSRPGSLQESLEINEDLKRKVECLTERVETLINLIATTHAGVNVDAFPRQNSFPSRPL